MRARQRHREREREREREIERELRAGKLGDAKVDMVVIGIVTIRVSRLNFYRGKKNVKRKTRASS